MAKLRRSIGFGALLLLAINAIIGTGIFFVPSIAAMVAGPASIISWIFVGLISLFIAMCFAELAGIYPKCGGIYEYSKNAYGETVGFVVGWTGWIVANITVAMLVVGSFSYLSTIVPIPGHIRLIAALLFVIGMNVINIRGINMSIKVLLFFAFATILALWFLISWGAYSVDLSQLTNISWVPKAGILVAMIFIFETFFGWETIAYLSEETKNPRRVLPKVMMYGTLAVILLAIGVVVVVLGVLPWQVAAASESPLVDAAHMFMPAGMVTFVTILIFLNIMGGAAAWIITTPRLIFALSRDGLLPKTFTSINKKYGTPQNAIIFQTVLTSLILLSGSYLLLLKVLLPLAIFMYSVGALLAVTKLRYSKPDAKRTFKVPLGKWLPVAIVVLLLALATNIEHDIILIGGLFILIGIPMYLLMALSFKPEVAKSFIDLSTFLMHYTYDYWVPLKLRKRVRRHFDEMKGKKMMELGCSVGKMSVELAKEVGPTGRVHATEVSKRSLKVAKKYAEDNGAKNIIFLLEDATQRHKLHEAIMDLDGVVSIGTLGYLNKPDKVLSELYKRIKPSGKIYFVDYDHIFRIIPTQGWLSDDKRIKAKFNKSGFDVVIDRESGKLWEIIHIYGKKKK